MQHEARQQGIGSALLRRLVEISEAEAFWTLQAQIMAGNHASRALHAKCGFREIGLRERLGHINGQWSDVVMLERRSRVTGGPGQPTRTCGG